MTARLESIRQARRYWYGRSAELQGLAKTLGLPPETIADQRAYIKRKQKETTGALRYLSQTKH